MRPDHVWLGVLAAATLFVFPCSAFAQTTTSTDAAIAELRQLLTDQRAALDRQARIIEEQGRRLAALQERFDGTNRSTEDRRALEGPATAAAAVGAQAPVAQQPTSRTAGEPAPDLPAMVVSAGEFPGSMRIPGQARSRQAVTDAKHRSRYFVTAPQSQRSIVRRSDGDQVALGNERSDGGGQSRRFFLGLQKPGNLIDEPRPRWLMREDEVILALASPTSSTC